MSLSSLTGQHGVMQVRMDLRDDDGLLNNGRVWLQADDIDVKPWLGDWMQDNIALETARFSLEGWMTIDKRRCGQRRRLAETRGRKLAGRKSAAISFPSIT